jgi:hypothetical protein
MTALYITDNKKEKKLKWSKELNRHLTREVIWVANKYMKRHSNRTSLGNCKLKQRDTKTHHQNNGNPKTNNTQHC